MKRLFLNGVSEVTVRVWAGVKFCSFIVAGIGLVLYLG